MQVNEEMESNTTFNEMLMKSNFYHISGALVLGLAVFTCLFSGVLLFVIRSDPLRIFSTRPIVSFTRGSCYFHIVQGLFGLYFGISEICHSCGIGLENGLIVNFKSFSSFACTFLITYRMFLLTSVMYERYMAFKFAHLHRRFVTVRNVSLLLSFVAAGLLVLTSIPWFLRKNTKKYLMFYVHMFITVPLVLLFIIEILHYWNMKHLRRVSTSNKDVTLGKERVMRESQRSITRSRKFIGIALANTIPLLTSILPWYILVIKFVYGHEKFINVTFRDFILQRLSVSFMFVEAVVTPLVYLRNSNYRNSARIIWVRLHRR